MFDGMEHVEDSLVETMKSFIAMECIEWALANYGVVPSNAPEKYVKQATGGAVDDHAPPDHHFFSRQTLEDAASAARSRWFPPRDARRPWQRGDSIHPLPSFRGRFRPGF